MPQGISLPSYNGQAITLTNLATHTSGLAPNVPSGAFNPSQTDFAAFVNGSSLAQAPEVNLGLFWISFPDDGQTFVYHAGGLTGASSDAVMSDPFQTGVVMLSNQNPLTTVGTARWARTS